MMRTNVLQLIGNLNQGGSERQAVQLVRLLTEDGRSNVLVACLEREGLLLKDLESAGYSDIPEFPLRSFYDLNAFRQVRRCAAFIMANHIDIVQTHDFYTNVFGMAAATLARTNVRIAAKRETGTRTPMQSVVERRAFGLADAIVANSSAVSRKLINEGVAKRKIVTIHNGVEPGRSSGESEHGGRGRILAELGLPGGRRFVTIVANLKSTVKNHRMFLRAAAAVKDRLSDTAFVIAGEGGMIDDLSRFAAKLGIKDDTYFIGRCIAVPELLSVSDVCCLTSFSEGFSNSILEYMLAGKPVVASNVGGAAEAVVDGKTGYLVKSDDDGALAERIISLLSDPEKAAAFGEAGRHLASEKFSPSIRLEKTLALYEFLLSKKQWFAVNDAAGADTL